GQREYPVGLGEREACVEVGTDGDVAAGDAEPADRGQLGIRPTVPARSPHAHTRGAQVARQMAPHEPIDAQDQGFGWHLENSPENDPVPFPRADDNTPREAGCAGSLSECSTPTLALERFLAPPSPHLVFRFASSE